MEITAVKVIQPSVSYPVVKNNDSPVPQKITKENEKPKVQAENGDKAKEKDEKELSKDEVIEINEALNSFMTAINSDLHFVIHERTKQIILQVVDRRDNKVVKEIPSEEMLDVIANIRESVGALLDKRV